MTPTKSDMDKPLPRGKQQPFYYICVFPNTYNNHTYFQHDQRDLADRYVKHVWERYRVNGMVKKVVEVEEG